MNKSQQEEDSIEIPVIKSVLDWWETDKIILQLTNNSEYLYLRMKNGRGMGIDTYIDSTNKYVLSVYRSLDEPNKRFKTIKQAEIAKLTLGPSSIAKVFTNQKNVPVFVIKTPFMGQTIKSLLTDKNILTLLSKVKILYDKLICEKIIHNDFHWENVVLNDNGICYGIDWDPIMQSNMYERFLYKLETKEQKKVWSSLFTKIDGGHSEEVPHITFDNLRL